MDDLLSSLCHARSQCQEQARESSLGLIAFHRLELAKARFDHLAGAREFALPASTASPEQRRTSSSRRAVVLRSHPQATCATAFAGPSQPPGTGPECARNSAPRQSSAPFPTSPSMARGTGAASPASPPVAPSSRTSALQAQGCRESPMCLTPQAINGPRFMYRALIRWLGGMRKAHSVCWTLHLV